MKSALLLPVCLIFLTFSACKKKTEIIIQQIPTNSNLTLIKYIAPNQWVLSGDGLTYKAVILDPKIDKRNFEDGGILVYISRSDTQHYEQIPSVYNLQAYSYIFHEGTLNIEIQSSYLEEPTPALPHSTTRVKIILLSSSK